jgi:cytochrome c peroxidase
MSMTVTSGLTRPKARSPDFASLASSISTLASDAKRDRHPEMTMGWSSTINIFVLDLSAACIWLKLAPDNQARLQVPTLRNVDKRPDPAFVKAYGHNGYFTGLKHIVHFYNTRDVLPRCQPHDRGESTTCWPAPESTANMNTSKVGHLGLSDAEEDALVLCMQTLTDGFMH